MSNEIPYEYLTEGEKVARQHEREAQQNEDEKSGVKRPTVEELRKEGYEVSMGPREPAGMTFAKWNEETYWNWKEKTQRKPDCFADDDPDIERRGKSFLQWRVEQENKRIDYDIAVAQNFGIEPSNTSASDFMAKYVKRKGEEMDRRVEDIKRRIASGETVSQQDLLLVMSSKPSSSKVYL